MSGQDDDSDKATIFSPGSGTSGVTPPAPGTAPQFPGIKPSTTIPNPAPQAPQFAAPQQFAPAPQGAGQAAGSGVKLDFASGEPNLYGPEPVVAAAGRLIHLGSHIRSLPLGPDLESLRRLVIEELDAFTRRVRTLGLQGPSVQLAHYILCAFIDDAVMSTPWGASSSWSRQSLLAAYHNDTQGGDRMFHFAEQMEREPNREPRLVELLYQCLSLGFEGRAALDPRMQSTLQSRRAGLAALIARQRGAQAADLSPNWRGQKILSGKFGPQVPLWALLSGIALIGLLIFAALLFRLSGKANEALAALNQAVGYGQPAAPPPPPQSATPLFDRIGQILAPDVAAGRLTLTREGSEIVISLLNQGLFASAQADAASDWNDTFGRLSQAANLTKGPIRVEGHTDDQAIRSLRFPSNQELSEARAQSVATALTSAGLSDAARLNTAGFGATRPVADNSSDEGRRQNRRVELRVANDIAWQ